MTGASKPFWFCNVKMTRDDYDDSAAKLAYARQHWHMRLTPLERRARCERLVTSKSKGKGQRVYQWLEERDGHVVDSDVIAIFEGYRDRFLENAFRRLVDLHPDDFNRCPACRRVVRTPTARFCPWCKRSR